MSEVDLSALRLEERPPPRRPRGTRIALALVGLLAVALLASFLVPLLRPVRNVRVAPVVATRGGGPARVALAEAAGWIEPEPFPVVVRPLVGGVLAELLVLEGQAVRAGETVLARLQSATLQAAADRAGPRVAQAEAAHARAQADLAVAEALLAQKAPLRMEEAAARRALADAGAALAARRGEHRAAEAQLAARRAELEGQEKLAEAGGTYPVALTRARAAVRETEARVDALAAAVTELEEQHAAAEAVAQVAAEAAADPRALEGDVARARAAVVAAAADAEAARAEAAIAARELAWAEVRAPVDGVVMKLLAAPGDMVGPDGHGVVALYDPRRLQARVDVPLASVGGVREGQEVEVRSEVTGAAAAKGVVLRVQRESDLLKNTLQVKVRLLDPDPLLRPETLVRARFLAPPGTDGAPVELFRVPRGAVRNGGAVFVLHPDGARRVAVEKVAEVDADVIVRGPLTPADLVILDPVAEGERVQGDME